MARHLQLLLSHSICGLITFPPPGEKKCQRQQQAWFTAGEPSGQARTIRGPPHSMYVFFFFLARCFGFALSYPVSRPPRRQGWGLKVAPITPQMAPLPTGMPAAVAANSSAAAATRSTNTNVDCTPARLKTSIAIDANVLF